MSAGGIAVIVFEAVEKEAGKAVVRFFKEQIVGKWSEYRAKKFLAALLSEIDKERDDKFTSADLNDMLAAVAKTENQTSALFEAYRRVALSASKDIGPMVIGLLTARIVSDDRTASETEELVFQAAEALNDKDFSSFLPWMDYVHQTRGTDLEKQAQAEDDGLPVQFLVKGGDALPSHIAESTLGVEAESPLTLNLFKDVGGFALKLRNMGLLEDHAESRGPPRASQGTNYFLMVSPSAEILYQLARRANEAAQVMRGNQKS